jgi:hypothetical protein
MKLREAFNGFAIFAIWGIVALLIWWIPRKIFGVI